MLHYLLPSVKGIPVLMYHKIWPGRRDFLTLTPEQLREQWTYLKAEGYSSLSLQQFLDIVKGKVQAPKKAVLLTFDDGYKNNLTHVYPLLKELGWQATIFIIGDTLDGTHSLVNDETDEKLSIAELKSMDTNTVQLALHGYHHADFNTAGIDGIKTEMLESIKAFDNAGLTYHKILAYPYGARPKNKVVLDSMKQWFTDNGIEAAFRIGNKVCSVPTRDIYEIRRIDIRGEDSHADFKIKLKKGKLRPF